MMRNFSGAMDEFCLFSRALDGTEIRTLYAEGKPEPGSFASLKRAEPRRTSFVQHRNQAKNS